MNNLYRFFLIIFFVSFSILSASAKNNIAYIGDDLIDIPVMDVVALPIAVANATSEVKKNLATCNRNSWWRGSIS